MCPAAVANKPDRPQPKESVINKFKKLEVAFTIPPPTHTHTHNEVRESMPSIEAWDVPLSEVVTFDNEDFRISEVC